MFCIAISKDTSNKKDLKVVLNFKKSQEQSKGEKIEFLTDKSNGCLLSQIISKNIKNSGETSSFDLNIILQDEKYSYKDQFVTLLSSILNNDNIKYTEENRPILFEIARQLQIPKLQSSIDRYSSYLDELNDFNFGRLPIIDEEFLCQLYLVNLTEDNIEDTQKASLRFIESLTVQTYSQILYRCFSSRLSNSSLYFHFIMTVEPNYHREFIKTIVRNFRNCSFLIFNTDPSLNTVNFLFRYFIENGIIKYDDIESLCVQNGMRSYTFQFFDYEHGHIRYDSTLYVYKHYDEISKDNFALHRKYVLIGKNQNPLFQIIEKDDIESFQKYMAFDSEATVDKIFERCYYESRPVLASGGFSLIEIAAFFGSVKIFKYLILNKATIRQDEMCKMAIYGGNSEIIRICKQNGVSFKKEFRFDNPIQIAIRMNHFDILRWLIEEERIPRSYSEFDIIGYALQYSNYYAYYYLIRVKYDFNFYRLFDLIVVKNSDDEEEEEEELEIKSNEKEEEETKDEVRPFKYNFFDVIIDLILSYNIPFLKNCMNRTNVNLTTCTFDTTGRNFLSVLFINYDKNLLDALLENNKLLRIDKFPVNNVSSKTVLDFGSYLIEHPKVTFVHDFFATVVTNSTKNGDIDDIEMVKEKVKILFDYAKSVDEKIMILPLILKYNLYDYFSKSYEEFFSDSEEQVSIDDDLFYSLIPIASIDLLSKILKKADPKSLEKINLLCYKIGPLIQSGKIDTFIFLISSDVSPFTATIKYDDHLFFTYFDRIQKVEDLKKFIQLFIEKNPESNFYEDVFLPNVLYNISNEINEVNKYVLNLPEIEPYLNKENTENEDYGHKPPLLYNRNFEVFMLNDKVDINIRQSETNDNLLCEIIRVERLEKLLSIDKFEYTIDDIIKSMKGMLYPYNKEIFELFLNGLLYDDKKSLIKIKLDFTDEQLSMIFHMICIEDDRYDLACQFYRKFSDRIDINYVDPIDNRSNLLDAIDCNSTKMVRFLLDIPTLDLNLRADTGCSAHDYLNSYNITPFCYAVECNVDEIINLFFKRINEIDINATYSKDIFFFLIYQITCLHCAAQYGTVMLVKKILEIPRIDKYKLDIIFNNYYFK